MRADSLATKGWIQSEGIEVASAGRISPSIEIAILIEYACRDFIGWLEERINFTGHTERCEP